MQLAECPLIKRRGPGNRAGPIQNFLAGSAHKLLGALPVSGQNIRETPQPRRKSNQFCPYGYTRSFGPSHYFAAALTGHEIPAQPDRTLSDYYDSGYNDSPRESGR